MGTFRMAPDALLDQTGLTGSLTDIQDDPDSADGNWLTTSNNTATVCRVSFGTPEAGSNLTSGATDQEFRVLLRKTNHSTDPTFTVELYESGSLVSTLATGVTLSTTTGQVYSYTWDGDLLTGSEGQNVEFRVSGSPGGGSPGNRASVEVGAVEWNAQTVEPAIEEFHVPPKPAYAMTPVRNDGIWSGIYRIFGVLPGAEFTEVITGERGEPSIYSNFSSFPVEETDDLFGPVIHSTGVSDRILWEMSPNGRNNWTTHIDPPYPAQGVTVAVLTKYNTSTDSSPAGTSIIQRYTGDTNDYIYRIYQSSGLAIQAGANLDGTFRTTSTDLTIPDNTWVWLVARWESGKSLRFEAFELDGQTAAAEVATTGTYSNLTWDLGATDPDSDYHALWGDSNGAYEGSAAAAMVWNRELTDTELAQFFSDPWSFYDPQLQTASAAGAITGNGAVTLGALTTSATGSVPRNGDGAVTLGALAVSATGHGTISGDAAVTLGALTVAATGTVADATITGNGAVTLGPLAVSATGHGTISGDAAVTLGALTVAGTGSVPIAGDGAVTLGPLDVTATGSVPVAGDGAVTLGALTTSASGTVAWMPRTGDGAVTLGALAVAGTGSVPVAGDGAVTLGALAVAATGRNIGRGDGAVTLGALETSASGTVSWQPRTGDGAITLAALVVDGTGSVPRTGDGAVTLGSLAIAGTGSVVGSSITGDGAVTLGALSTAADGSVQVHGDGAITLGALGTSSAGGVDVSGDAGILLGVLAVAGTGSVPRTGDGAVSLGALTIGSTGSVPRDGDGTITLGALQVNGWSYGDAGQSPWTGTSMGISLNIGVN